LGASAAAAAGAGSNKQVTTQADDSHYVNPSTLFACFDEDSYVSTQLADEPLYQFYTATVLEVSCFWSSLS
jgi:hypothetical protein